MQSILFLRSPEGETINRLINIDLLATAHPSDKNPTEWTEAVVGIAQITIHMPFAEFVEQVQKLIADNYRAGAENAAFWHKKRTDDMAAAIEAAMKHIHQ